MAGSGWALAFFEGQLMTYPGGVELPGVESFSSEAFHGEPLVVGGLRDRPAFALRLEHLPSDLQAVPLRQVLASGDVELATVAGRAAQLLEWEAAHTYCGRCGNLTRSHPSELARECQACQQLYFPRIAPVVIMAVRREGELLLAHNRGMREDLYSLLAGFVEVGESLEQAVLREVREEVGLEVGGLRYLASQPWPFPSQLMVGFEARWQGGEIRIQEEELSDAGWFPIDELPPADCLPADYSIASRIIRGLS